MFRHNSNDLFPPVNRSFVSYYDTWRLDLVSRQVESQFSRFCGENTTVNKLIPFELLCFIKYFQYYLYIFTLELYTVQCVSVLKQKVMAFAIPCTKIQSKWPIGTHFKSDKLHKKAIFEVNFKLFFHMLCMPGMSNEVWGFFRKFWLKQVGHYIYISIYKASNVNFLPFLFDELLSSFFPFRLSSAIPNLFFLNFVYGHLW